MIHPSRRSCSGAAATSSSMEAAGINTAPSSSTTIQSSGNTATPPQPIGSPQFTNVSPATEGGAAAPWHHTGSPVARTPATSRTTPSVMRAFTPRLAMRARGDRLGPRFGRRQVLARGHEAHRECLADQARLARIQRARAAHPDVAQALLEEDGGDGGGRHLLQRGDDVLLAAHGRHFPVGRAKRWILREPPEEFAYARRVGADVALAHARHAAHVDAT